MIWAELSGQLFRGQYCNFSRALDALRPVRSHRGSLVVAIGKIKPSRAAGPLLDGQTRSPVRSRARRGSITSRARADAQRDKATPAVHLISGPTHTVTRWQVPRRFILAHAKAEQSSQHNPRRDARSLRSRISSSTLAPADLQRVSFSLCPFPFPDSFPDSQGSDVDADGLDGRQVIDDRPTRPSDRSRGVVAKPHASDEPIHGK